jgi:hypothetical protein
LEQLAFIFLSMKKISLSNHDSAYPSATETQPGRETNWCEKYGYFIDLTACQARSLNRSACRRCYKSLLQLSLPF